MNKRRIFAMTVFSSIGIGLIVFGYWLSSVIVDRDYKLVSKIPIAVGFVFLTYYLERYYSIWKRNRKQKKS